MSWRPTTDPVVITCALTGGIHGKEANPALPEQPDEIVGRASPRGARVQRCCTFMRAPRTAPTPWTRHLRRAARRLCAETDAVVQLTTGGSPRLSVEERMTTVRLAPEMCSLNMGLLNFFIAGEQVFFPNHRSTSSASRARSGARRAARARGLFGVMLEEAAVLLATGILEPPYAINFVLHTPTQGGARGTPRNLLDMCERCLDLSASRGRRCGSPSRHGCPRSSRSRRWRARWG